MRRFNRALLRGLEYTLDNPEEAGEIMLADVPEVTAESVAAEVRLMEPTPGRRGPARVHRRGPRIAGDRAGRVRGGIRPGIQADEFIRFDLTPGVSEEE